MSVANLVIAAIPGWSLLAALVATIDRVSGGRLLGPRLLARIAVWGVGLSAASAVAAAAIAYGATGSTSQVDLGTWLATTSLQVDVGFLLDPLSATMAVTIAGLSWLVARFSVNYLHNEPGVERYFTVLPLFVGAMLLLVLADNYLILFLAWEVVGACSYLLIAFYRDRSSAAEAATRAFVLNRIGDAGLLAGLFVLASSAGTLSFSELLTSPLPTATATAVGFCLL
ncbi:MAG: NADH-quinone oxidoreductase subunit L, partial [Actinomycetota bacterium]|nr:NADH-quinone oxidoreductase subunit L [Actinomycetota bacterium]